MDRKIVRVVGPVARHHLYHRCCRHGGRGGSGRIWGKIDIGSGGAVSAVSMISQAPIWPVSSARLHATDDAAIE